MRSKSGKAGERPARGVTAASQPELRSRRAETAVYVAVMCSELAIMANGAGLGLTGHFLAMAKAEAERLTAA